MNIKDLLKEGREIWDDKKLTLPEIIARMGKIFGDICRWERNEPKDKEIHTDKEIKKELGNMIFSTIRWCDDMGHNPKECIKIAKEAQKEYRKTMK